MVVSSSPKERSKVRIQAMDNGPFMVTGEVEYLDGKGQPLLTSQSGYLCRCGKSEKKPYCSGACMGRFKNTVRSR